MNLPRFYRRLSRWCLIGRYVSIVLLTTKMGDARTAWRMFNYCQLWTEYVSQYVWLVCIVQARSTFWNVNLNICGKTKFQCRPGGMPSWFSPKSRARPCICQGPSDWCTTSGTQPHIASSAQPPDPFLMVQTETRAMPCTLPGWAQGQAHRMWWSGSPKAGCSRVKRLI